MLGRGLVGSEPQDTPVPARGWFWVDKNQTDGHLCWEKKARALLQPQKIWVGKKEMFNWPDPLISDVQVSYKYSSYHQV